MVLPRAARRGRRRRSTSLSRAGTRCSACGPRSMAKKRDLQRKIEISERRTRSAHGRTPCTAVGRVLRGARRLPRPTKARCNDPSASNRRRRRPAAPPAGSTAPRATRGTRTRPRACIEGIAPAAGRVYPSSDSIARAPHGQTRRSTTIFFPADATREGTPPKRHLRNRARLSRRMVRPWERPPREPRRSPSWHRNTLPISRSRPARSSPR
jgi:hypothetical protein